MDVSAYRIVQEALTNVLRHSPGAEAEVLVRFGAESVELVVTNDQRADGDTSAQNGGGLGLVGMRERAALLGGRLDAGPGDDGRFVVRAWLPR